MHQSHNKKTIKEKGFHCTCDMVGIGGKTKIQQAMIDSDYCINKIKIYTLENNHKKKEDIYSYKIPAECSMASLLTSVAVDVDFLRKADSAKSSENRRKKKKQ